MDLWDKSIDLDGEYIDKYHSSAGEIFNRFYLYINLYVGLVNVYLTFQAFLIGINICMDIY